MARVFGAATNDNLSRETRPIVDALLNAHYCCGNDGEVREPGGGSLSSFAVWVGGGFGVVWVEVRADSVSVIYTVGQFPLKNALKLAVGLPV